MGKKNHTNRLNGFRPTVAGMETVESTLKFPIDCRDWFLSKTLWELESLLVESNEPFFHLKEPMPCVKGKESLLCDSLLGVPGNLSLGLLLGLTFAFAETVGVI